MFALFAVMVATSVNAQTTTINYTAKQKIVTPCLSPCDPEGKKTKTLGRRYPKAVLPNVPYPLSTKAFPAKTLGCEGHFDVRHKNKILQE